MRVNCAAFSTHVAASVFLITFGKTGIDCCLSQAFEESVDKFNENVKKKRHTVSRLIDAVFYLGMQELAFRGHDESADCHNGGNYVELLYLLAQQDERLNNHLQASMVFSGTFNDSQNDLIEAISSLMIEAIKKEIAHTSFIAIIMDDTTDISNTLQLVEVVSAVKNDPDELSRSKTENPTEWDHGLVQEDSITP
ncbi:hypothetical protein ILUMI_16803 [Ignelater luminosus]|uniref:DUF4371 domain-containing protein n=1 Tax=Ignelater luminosus TaxID=2038154 RepID=A0A8K0CL85_IGNLU|nr:hypothetical protein ILUMI_16803 [Ignelater luminosus]